MNFWSAVVKKPSSDVVAQDTPYFRITKAISDLPAEVIEEVIKIGRVMASCGARMNDKLTGLGQESQVQKEISKPGPTNAL